MDLKAVLGEQYREDMTLAEVAEALQGMNLVDPASLPPSVEKTVFDKTAKELAELKKSKLSEEERAKEQADEVSRQIAELQKENARMKQERAFLAAGYDEKTAGKLSQFYADGDIAGFTACQNEFMSAQKKSLEASIKADLLKKTPGMGGGKDEEKDSAVEMAKSFAQRRAAEAEAGKSALAHYVKET